MEGNNEVTLGWKEPHWWTPASFSSQRTFARYAIDRSVVNQELEQESNLKRESKVKIHGLFGEC